MSAVRGYTSNYGSAPFVVDDNGLTSASEIDKFFMENDGCAEFIPVTPELYAWFVISSDVLNRTK